MKKLILTILSSAILTLCHAQSVTNIILYTGFQWSTNNGVTWANDIFPLPGDPDLDDVIAIPVGDFGPQCGFFKAVIADNGNLDVWHSFIVTNYAGLTVDAITNPIATNTFYVYPNPVDGYGTNIIYRSMMSLTNYAAPVFTGTNSTIDTNLPPNP